MESKLTAVIFGESGAVGRTLVPLLVESSKWSKVLCVVRNEPQQGKKLKENGKLQVQIQANMDRLLQPQEWKLAGFDAMFVCFGSQVKHGQETFVKVDKTYPLMCADIAVNSEISHYILVSSGRADVTSSFLFMRTKGELQRDVKLKSLNRLSIIKPGLIKNRPDERFEEKIGQVLSYALPLPSIECYDLIIQITFQQSNIVFDKINSSQRQ